MYDPNSTMPVVREVRVTMRGVRLSENGSPVQVSTRSDFIAPEVSPVRLIDSEAEKGTRGWTDYDVKLSLAVNGGKTNIADRQLAALSVGKTVIRKVQPAMRVMYSGPRGNRG